MSDAITTTEIFLIAMGIIFTVPYLIWRLLRTDCGGQHQTGKHQ